MKSQVIVSRIRLILFLITLGSLKTFAAQPVDTLITEWEELAQFEEASAIGIDPSGLIYVVDEGRHLIYQLAANGEKLQQFGGPGDAEGQFDSPSDIDATNGLVLVVADAGNGRIQRFSRDFLFLETLPVGLLESDEDAAFSSQPGYRQREQQLVGFGTGRPIALLTSPDNEMYAIDEVGNVIIKWDQDRNVEQVIGSYDQGDGRLIEPVALALDRDGNLFVADRGLETIVVYDVYGGFDRTIADGLCAEVQSVYIAGERLFIALKDRLLLYHKRGRLERVIAVGIDGDIEDIAMRNGMMYLLSKEKLYRASLLP